MASFFLLSLEICFSTLLVFSGVLICFDTKYQLSATGKISEYHYRLERACPLSSALYR